MSEVRKDDEWAGIEPNDDDVPRRVRGIGHEVGALGILHLVVCDDHRTVCGRHQRLLPAVDRRIARLVGEDPAAVQPDEIESESLIVGHEMVVLKGTLTALQD